MPSKMIVDRQKSAKSVVAAGDTNADAVGEQMKRELLAYLKKGEAMPDFALVMKLLGRALDHRTHLMVTADETHEAELRDDDAPRAGRDAGAAKLDGELSGLRDAVASIYGGATAAGLGIPGELPRDPAMLLQLGRAVLKAIPKVKLPKPLLMGASVDLKAGAQQIEKTCDELAAHIGDVAREVREAQVTQVAKNESISGYDTWFTGTAGVFSGFLNLIGKRELADRVRPSRRRPGTTAGGDEGGNGDTGTGGTGDGGGTGTGSGIGATP